MNNLKIARDDNTIYMSVTCDNKEDMSKVLDLINKIIAPEAAKEMETLEGAKNVKRGIPEPVRGAEEITPEPEKENIEKNEEVKSETPSEAGEKAEDICPICGERMVKRRYGMLCEHCGFQEKVYGLTLTDEMISAVKEKGQTDVLQFNSRTNGPFKGYLKMTDGKIKFYGVKEEKGS